MTAVEQAKRGALGYRPESSCSDWSQGTLSWTSGDEKTFGEKGPRDRCAPCFGTVDEPVYLNLNSREAAV